MRLRDVYDKNYECHKQLADELGISQPALAMMLYRNPRVLELADGRFITVTKKNKLFGGKHNE